MVMSSIFYLPLELNSEIEEVYYLYKGIVADYNVNTEFSTYHWNLTVKSKRSITFTKGIVADYNVNAECGIYI